MDSEEGPKMIAATGNNFALNIPSDTPGERCAYFLRLIYHDAKAKRIARDYDVSEPTARLWLAGKLPTSEHLTTMARRYGWRFIAFVFGQLPLDIRLDAHRDVLTAQLHAQERDNDSLHRPQNAAASPTSGAVASEPRLDVAGDRGPTDRGRT
jgi:hypothetical protein